eukprot:1010506-Rhodomonas_salina.1
MRPRAATASGIPVSCDSWCDPLRLTAVRRPTGRFPPLLSQSPPVRLAGAQHHASHLAHRAGDDALL